MQVDLQQDYLSILTSIFHYIEIIPNTFAIELNNIIIRQIGARYFIKNMYNFFLLNADDCSISLAILSNPTVRTIKKHVASAASGIITEFVRKSKSPDMPFRKSE